MNTELLSKLNDKSIELIKKEAENNLEAIHKVEDVITSKLNNLLNICITFFIITSGYLVKLLSYNKISVISILTFLVVILLVIVVFLIYSSILPKTTIIIGSEPIKLVSEEFIFGHENDYFRIISNRVYNLQDAIDKANVSYRERKDVLKKANKTLLIGLVIILIIGCFIIDFRFFQCWY